MNDDQYSSQNTSQNGPNFNNAAGNGRNYSNQNTGSGNFNGGNPQNNGGNYDNGNMNSGNGNGGNFENSTGGNSGGNFNNGNGNNGNNGNGGNSGNQNNNNRNIIIAVLATLAVAIAAYFLFIHKKEKKTTAVSTMIQPDTTAAVAPLADSLQIEKTADMNEEGYEEEEYVTESYVIANEAFLRSTPSSDAASKVRSLKFGDKLYAKNSELINGYSTVYLSKPANEKNITEQPYYLLESTLVSQYQYAEFKEYFSLPPFSTLASKTKKLILDKDYADGTEYKVTQNSDRAKNALTYGDYDRDGIMDIAIVLDNNEKQTSRLLVICTNKATKEPYLAFAENYSDKVRINTFKKGASVFMDSEEFISSPADGVIVKGEDIKMALIYDSSNQKFKTYYQE